MLGPTEKLQVSIITGGASSLIFYFADGPENFFRLCSGKILIQGTRLDGEYRVTKDVRSQTSPLIPTLFKCFNYFIYKPYCLVLFKVIERYLFYVLFSVLVGSRRGSTNFVLRSFLNLTVQVVWRSVF